MVRVPAIEEPLDEVAKCFSRDGYGTPVLELEQHLKERVTELLDISVV